MRILDIKLEQDALVVRLDCLDGWQAGDYLRQPLVALRVLSVRGDRLALEVPPDGVEIRPGECQRIRLDAEHIDWLVDHGFKRAARGSVYALAWERDGVLTAAYGVAPYTWCAAHGNVESWGDGPRQVIEHMAGIGRAGDLAREVLHGS